KDRRLLQGKPSATLFSLKSEVVQQGPGKYDMIVSQQPAWLLQGDSPLHFPMRDRRLLWMIPVLATAVMRRDDAEEDVAFFHSRQTILESRLVGENRNRPLVRHPDLVSERSEQCIN